MAPRNLIGPGPERDAIIAQLTGRKPQHSSPPARRDVQTSAQSLRDVAQQVAPEWFKKASAQLPSDARVDTNAFLNITGQIMLTALLPRVRKMNKWETAFGQLLDEKKRSGQIDDFEFEALSFKLARGARYKPDWVAWSGARVICYEVKGHWREAARVRIKVAAHRYRWASFVAVTRKNQQWSEERFEP